MRSQGFMRPSHPPTRSASASRLLLPLLPDAALALVVPRLPPATRAALRCASRELRRLTDAHTARLSLAPSRWVADSLMARGVRVRHRRAGGPGSRGRLVGSPRASGHLSHAAAEPSSVPPTALLLLPPPALLPA
jgi:hypothetical protein